VARRFGPRWRRGAQRVTTYPCGSLHGGGTARGGWGLAIDGELLACREAVGAVDSWFFGSRMVYLREVTLGTRRHSNDWWCGDTVLGMQARGHRDP
jgi:hypothetical protein